MTASLMLFMCSFDSLNVLEDSSSNGYFVHLCVKLFVIEYSNIDSSICINNACMTHSQIKPIDSAEKNV